MWYLVNNKIAMEMTKFHFLRSGLKWDSRRGKGGTMQDRRDRFLLGLVFLGQERRVAESMMDFSVAVTCPSLGHRRPKR
jgi:hypothetical protein